ncbi:hypothetical protein CWRG_02479 [Chthonomonas calidirosea]|uniref:Uncharacterized protein n=1 Tax=Chthonomonas calidirosea (strain DSM 23976 / ICMP 18418 / T49) TaxID=1303518 RepID=S0EUS4_CHTCT|nr:hypothetical protein [Chthonomonas calidirosea]CCW35415.1 hypothetical protein CCALI_01599 [Chthonomonas calidirosea T49]CEK19360.1 hypothetical protein CP488_02496 [Chthonomonas calidirosea]CEK19362.1 hypothetical protein CWRG_02479 [Chthonomonas calidirosea]CEK20344.1 hypothetical protein CTKA_02501 [Chthonomonas calidirosea]
MRRYLNTFNVVGVLLVILSLFGFATGGRALTEPGSKTEAISSLVYLGTGVLMLINGFVSVKMHPADPSLESTKKR